MKKAMILAAGRGERLRPLTDTCPKALMPIQGIPLIDYHLTALAKAGFTDVIINHAWLGGHIVRHAGNGERFGLHIAYTPEPPGGLETGGGILNALPLLGNEPFLVVNADIFTAINFQHIQSITTQFAHLLLRPRQEKERGDFGLNGGFITNSPRDYVFLGIAIYHPLFFKDLRPGRFSLTPLWRKMAEKELMTGSVWDDPWIDIGSPKNFALAQTMSFTTIKP